ncbi:MAG: glycosyltransferase family 4 protein [Granulosicoccus sp.]
MNHQKEPLLKSTEQRSQVEPNGNLLPDINSSTAQGSGGQKTDSHINSFPVRNGQALRVLFAVDSRFPGLGGAETQALKLAVALREQGVYVEFVTPLVNISQPLQETYHDFVIRRIDYPHVRWLGSLIVMQRFARYLKDNEHRFDAIHVHITHLMAAAAGFARARIAIPVITKVSGFYEFEGGVLDPAARFKPLNILIRQGLKKVDFVQTISFQTREKLLRAGFSDTQIQFVPNGIDARQLPVETPSSDAIRIGYCGRLREVKGVHVLLDAFAALKADYPEKSLKLVIAGSGETQTALVEQAETLGIDADIEWLGLIHETSSFFHSIHIYVQPSFAEGLPNSVMEAMVARRPVVATDIGGNSDLVQEGVSGLLFETGNAIALAGQLARLLDEPELSRRLAGKGRQLIVERYGIDLVTRKLAALYLA